MSNELHVEVSDGVLLVTIDRPEAMNALSDGVTRGLLEALEQAQRDDEVRALVVTGTGRAFCAGAEISATGESPTQRQAAPASRAQRMDWMSRSGRIVEAFRHCDVPVLAAVNGAAAGAGFGIALCCDGERCLQGCSVSFVLLVYDNICTTSPGLPCRVVCAAIVYINNVETMVHRAKRRNKPVVKLAQRRRFIETGHYNAEIV